MTEVKPNKCFYCQSENIKKDGEDWECLDCGCFFDLNKYHAIFVVDIEFESPSDDKEEMAWEFLTCGNAELIGIFKDGMKANIKFSCEE